MTTHVEGMQELLGMAGRQLGNTSWFEVTQQRVEEFAAATNDHQWIHVDPERAARSPLGGTIAHGYFTLSLAAPFLGELLEVHGVGMALNYGLNRVRFPAPLRVGSRVRAGGEIVAVRQRGEAVEVTLGLSYETEGSATPPCIAEVVVLYRPDEATPTAV